MLLRVDDVHQYFRTGFWLRSVHVLKGISIEVPKGAIFGFLGANGAGKTTLIHLITGLRKPSRGRVMIGEWDAFAPAARSRIGYLPERPYFHDHLTGKSLLRYFGNLSGMNRAELAARIPDVLATVGLSHAADVELRKYSKGMLQRIGIAQAILHQPEFLVLDEPMSGLDPIGRKEIRELIVKLAGEGRTIFFSSHVIPDVESICDQVALIENGSLLEAGPINRLLGSGPLQAEIGVSGVSAEFCASLAELSDLRQVPDGVRGTVSGQEALQRVLSRVLEARGQVLWVTPIRPSLESFFKERR